MNNNISKLSGKIPSEINKKTSPQKSVCSPQKSLLDGGSGTTEFSLDQQVSSKRQISSTGKIKIGKKGLSSKNSISEAFDTENERLVCEKCGILKDSVIKTLTSLKQYVDSINENINILYHKTNNIKKLSQNNFFSNDFFQFYAEVDKLKCGTNLSNNIRSLMKAIKILSDKYDYILNKQEYYEKVVSLFANIKSSNKDDDFSKINKELSANIVENISKESYDIPELFKKYTASKEAADKLIKDLKSSLNDSNLKNEDKIMSKDIEINLDYHDQFKENLIKNEYFRLQKENVSLRMELSLIYEQMREDNKIFEIKDSHNVRKNSKDFSQNNKRKNSHSNSGLYGQLSSNNNQQSVNANPALFIKLKNENTEEIYVHYKNFINRLKMSEFL